jgi:disulfide bond formation protein DsbB
MPVTSNICLKTAIASYHVGVEKKIFKGLDSCQSDLKLNEVKNLEELKAAMLATKAINCSEPSFVFLGLSMAAWNALFCLTLIGSVLLFLKIKTLRTNNSRAIS